ncbi:MAG: hypothetical protein HYX41_05600, partial [Bdellovibrio sp.]|nr:hypothetical protein [Bdellovibrio sp.]
MDNKTLSWKSLGSIAVLILGPGCASAPSTPRDPLLNSPKKPQALKAESVASEELSAYKEIEALYAKDEANEAESRIQL